jgi:hypothetical protein
LGLPVLARVKDNKKIVEANHSKVPISIYDSLNEISKEIKRFAAVLVGQKEKKSIFVKLFRLDLRKESVNRELARQKFYEAQFK